MSRRRIDWNKRRPTAAFIFAAMRARATYIGVKEAPRVRLAVDAQGVPLPTPFQVLANADLFRDMLIKVRRELVEKK